MTPTSNPDLPLLTDPPVSGRNYANDQGISKFSQWEDTPDKITSQFDALKATADAGGNHIASLEQRNSKGRSTLIARFTSEGQGTAGYPNDVTVMEELYAIDVLKDMSTAPYFSETLTTANGFPAHMVAAQDAGTKGLPLTDNQVAFVRDVSSRNMSEDAITAHSSDTGNASTYAWANWTIGMKELRYHLIRGADTYFETGFVFRRGQHGVQRSQVQASFDGINAIAKDAAGDALPVPTFSSQMGDLIESLPAGEWLYKPPQAEHMGGGRWRVTQEWHYAKKWSIVYGGTWNFTPP